MGVEVRKIEEKELDSIEEEGACGTAAVITPIGKISDPEKYRMYIFSKK